jgi:hypothetical protein
MSSKKTQGFSSTGGRGIAPKSVPSYTADELSALSRLDPDASAYGNAGTTTLCDLCGLPIASASPYERPDERFSFFEQAKNRKHMACYNRAVRIADANAQEKVKAEQQAYDALPQSEKDRLEEIEAAKFNDGGGIDPRSDALVSPVASKINLEELKKRGLAATQSEEDAEIERQTRETEARLRAEFEAEQARMTKQAKHSGGTKK